MMKKVMIFLLGLMILALPLGVSAKTAAEISNKPVAETESEDGKSVIKTYEVYIKTTENEELSSASIGFEYGKAVTAFDCVDAGEFKVGEENVTAENKVSCTFTADPAKKGEKILVGKLVVTANKNAADEDCTINYIYEGAQGKINPETGIEIPYLIIAGGLVLATGVYFTTRKKTALFKI